MWKNIFQMYNFLNFLKKIQNHLKKFFSLRKKIFPAPTCFNNSNLVSGFRKFFWLLEMFFNPKKYFFTVKLFLFFRKIHKHLKKNFFHSKKKLIPAPTCTNPASLSAAYHALSLRIWLVTWPLMWWTCSLAPDRIPENGRFYCSTSCSWSIQMRCGRRFRGWRRSWRIRIQVGNLIFFSDFLLIKTDKISFSYNFWKIFSKKKIKQQKNFFWFFFQKFLKNQI